MPTIIDLDKVDYSTGNAIRHFLSIKENADAQVAKYKALASAPYKITPYKPYFYDTQQFKFKRGWETREKLLVNRYGEDIFVDTIETLQTWAAKDAEILKENQLICAANNASYNALMSLIKELGIPTSGPDPKSKKRYPDTLTKPFVLEWQNHFKIGCPDKTYHWKTTIAEAQKQIDKIAAEKAAEEAKKVALEKEQKEQALILELVKKYDIDVTEGLPTKDDVLQVLFEADKYLYLAHFLALNRSDWNDGYSYAETGLAHFEIVEDIDKQIYMNIQACIDSGEDGLLDGRIFRDTEWNYDRIFGLAKPEIYADYIRLSNS